MKTYIFLGTKHCYLFSHAYTLENLTPNSNYLVNILAVNEFGSTLLPFDFPISTSTDEGENSVVLCYHLTFLSLLLL